MKKILLLLAILSVTLCAFAAKPFSVGLSASPILFESLHGDTTYKTSYSAAARVDIDYPINDNFHAGFALMGSFGYFKKLECQFVTSYYAIGKFGYTREISDSNNTVGIEAEFGYEWSHVHPTSKSAFTVGADLFFKHPINDQVNLKAGCEMLVTPAKTKIAFEGKYVGLTVIPTIGAEVWFNK